jgi:hypothetical protein
MLKRYGEQVTKGKRKEWLIHLNEKLDSPEKTEIGAPGTLRRIETHLSSLSRKTIA